MSTGNPITSLPNICLLCLLTNSIWILSKDSTRSERDVSETHLPSYQKRDDDDEDDDRKTQRGQRIVVCHKCLYFMVSNKQR